MKAIEEAVKQFFVVLSEARVPNSIESVTIHTDNKSARAWSDPGIKLPCGKDLVMIRIAIEQNTVRNEEQEMEDDETHEFEKVEEILNPLTKRAPRSQGDYVRR